MHAQRNDQRGNLTLAIVAAFLALVGPAIILFDDFGARSNSQGKGSSRMVRPRRCPRLAQFGQSRPQAGSHDRTKKLISAFLVSIGEKMVKRLNADEVDAIE
jgi:hypothetical protein